jgi:hypothetical protein
MDETYNLRQELEACDLAEDRERLQRIIKLNAIAGRIHQIEERLKELSDALRKLSPEDPRRAGWAAESVKLSAELAALEASTEEPRSEATPPTLAADDRAIVKPQVTPLSLNGNSEAGWTERIETFIRRVQDTGAQITKGDIDLVAHRERSTRENLQAEKGKGTRRAAQIYGEILAMSPQKFLTKLELRKNSAS